MGEWGCLGAADMGYPDCRWWARVRVFDRGCKGRSNVALLPACVADLRSQGVAVVE